MPSSEGKSATELNTATSSRLLALPAELRNRIFATCFKKTTIKENLLTAHPPSKSLLLTCHKIYAEAKEMHRKACRDFWSDSTFLLPVPNGPGSALPLSTMRAAIGSIDPRALDRIERLRIGPMQKRRPVQGRHGVVNVLAFDKGFWSYWKWDTVAPSMGGKFHEIWFQDYADKVWALRKAGYWVVRRPRTRWRLIDLEGESAERVELAELVSGKAGGLTAEEILLATTRG